MSRFVLFLNGPPGVGKTTVLEHVGDLLAEWEHPFTLMDVDWFHRSWPPTEDGNRAIEAANMRHAWAAFDHDAPARQLVVSGVITSDRARQRYEDAFGLPIRSVGLRASRSVILERLTRRYAGERPGALQWHLEHLDLSLVAARAYLADETTLDTAGSARSIALAALAAVGIDS